MADLAELFTELAQTPSPSGKEKKMSVFLCNYFKKLGWKVWVDNTSKKNNSDTGNVYALLKINKDFDTFAFSAHMDTVQKEGDDIKVKFDGKLFKSDGKTILGADNKAGVTALLAVARKIESKKLKHNLLFFFPTREEAGLMGSSLFSNKGVGKIKYFFNLDGGDKPGVFVYKALGCEGFTINIKGKAAHAAKEYDKGKDAIKAAGLLINLIPTGKNAKNGTTLNIGKIAGGASTNVVCDSVELKGELRGFTQKAMTNLQKVILAKSKIVEKKLGVKIEVVFNEHSAIPPFSGNPNTEICNFCKKATKKAGLAPKFEKAFYTCDANFYSSKGYEAINVSRGGSNAHSNNESLLLSDLKNTISLINMLITSG